MSKRPATRGEVDKLKDNWEKDPCFDLYSACDNDFDSEVDFSEWRDHLINHQKKKEKEWKEAEKRRIYSLDKKLFELKLHESYFDNRIPASITRVPSGWIYEIENKKRCTAEPYIETKTFSHVFVPYFDGFKIQ